MAGFGLQAIRAAAPRRLVLACAVASSLVVAFYGHLPFLGRTSASNLQEAGAYLNGLEEETVEVFTPRREGAPVNPAVSVPMLDLYATKRVVYAYEEPPPEVSRAVQTSPLRFTWEYRNPGYYAEGGPPPEERTAVVVVSDDLDAPLPADLERRLGSLDLARTFARDEGVFEHRTLVRVYRSRAPEGAPGHR